MTDVLVIMCTFPSESKARQIGTHLVERQYVACVNILPSVKSIYRWEGKINHESECMVFMKTTRQIFPELSKELSSIHPYDEPGIIALPVVDGAESYLDWVVSSLGEH